MPNIVEKIKSKASSILKEKTISFNINGEDKFENDNVDMQET